jgi:hypothetical protein
LSSHAFRNDPGPPSKAEPLALDVVLVIDASDSHDRPYGSVQRLTVASRVLQVLGEAATRIGTHDRVGLVRVGAGQTMRVGLTRLASGEGRRELDRALLPGSLARTDRPAILPPLAEAGRLLRPSPGLRYVLLLIDGDDHGTREVNAGIQAAAPAGIHVFATGPVSPAWRHVPVASVSDLGDHPVTLDRLDALLTKVILLTASRGWTNRTGAVAS